MMEEKSWAMWSTERFDDGFRFRGCFSFIVGRGLDSRHSSNLTMKIIEDIRLQTK